jgi:hypothetical protein
MSSNEYLKILTMMHGYYNTMYNWQRQIPGQLRRGEGNKAFTTFFNSVLVTAFFGAAVYTNPPAGESWFKTMGKEVGITPLKMIPGLGDLATMAAQGYDPRTPVGGLFKTLINTSHDAYIGAAKGEHTKILTHGAQLVGAATGLPVNQLGRSAQFAYDAHAGIEAPKNIIDWMKGLVYGTIKPPKN